MTDVGLFDRDIRGQNGPRERSVGRLADHQYGVVSFEQLRGLGIGEDSIQHRLSIGRLRAIHVGVYAVGHTALPPRGRWMAAVLACGEEAMLSHRSAAALWGIRGTARAGVDVTALGRTRNRQPGIDVHRPRRFDDVDRTGREGIPVTTVARTLLDLAEVVPRQQLARAFEESDRLGLLDLRQVGDVVERARGRRGLRPLRALLEQHRPAPAWTRSELERRFARLLAAEEIPTPSFNAWVEGFEVDAVWRDRRLIVELDGWEHHRTRSAFERDRGRDLILEGFGYEIVRLTQRLLESRRTEIVTTLREKVDLG